ncbi:type II secretion system protein [Paraeggerthella hongkongensis]|uniref:type II secretion system F family protein n=1 Tax=Paraeggerthella sp. TaxID=2897350 RepID=UPI000DF85449|nr:type II secretion system protein [Paraeggerthella hongkongensis]
MLLAELSFALAAGAALTAGIGGWCFAATWADARAAACRRRRARASLETEPMRAGRGVVGYLQRLTRLLALGATRPLSGGMRSAGAQAWWSEHARKAGLKDGVSAQGFVEASVRLAGAGMLVGVAAGLLFSVELAAIGALAGATAGATLPARAVRRAERQRVEALGRSLSEMLEVVSLGLRSGLSFDRSFQLYGTHFNTPFARECAAAQRAWTSGLSTREDALRSLAASYDAPALGRVVENVVRSLRFGTSLAEILEAASVEARAEHRAYVEERVAKAPVKMMVPTGTLILPAMLLLVLGPVLLELMEGF